jgi:hypothetical protein
MNEGELERDNYTSYVLFVFEINKQKSRASYKVINTHHMSYSRAAVIRGNVDEGTSVNQKLG